MTFQHKTAEDLIASLDAFIMSRPAAPKPVTREEAAAIRADLDARQRAGRTVMLRNNKGRFIGSMKVATFGKAPAAPVATTERTDMTSNHEARAVMATWLPDTLDQARTAFDLGRGWSVHGGNLLLDAADLRRINQLNLPLWVRLANDQIVCIRAKASA